jgi:hydrogenase maturation protease
MSMSVDQQGTRHKILVIGLGNPDRGDDAVGAITVQRLAGRLPADVTLLVRSGDILSLIEDWVSFDALVCVDAAAPRGAPGRIHRIDLATDELPPNKSFPSSHTFGLAEAIRLARTLRCAPRDIIVYAVEGCCFDGGAPVTAAVSAAVSEVERQVIAEVERLRRSATEAVLHA